ncbi:protein tyrosine phosphatase [Streptomyces sp. CB03234]|uniref:tyrosine-protein phosphatase n=1 Tax=Streptomyces sp. (strain CB03234) TaxID=1703937 RepID=UPI00093E53C9|nr:tyrosine-protein phosphatase [Streptomyces sp. CB03234]OKK08426.1 protein tyrosine phosphatase [Streptomyces sp. CB03234]
MALTRRTLLMTATTAALMAATGTAGASTAGRHIPLQGAVNVRDLGGHRTYDGETVRHGLVYRADGLSRLTDADLVTLSGLRLTKVIDFRIPLEVQYDGPDRLPDGLVPVSRPVTDNGLYARLRTAIGSADPVRQEELLGGGRAAAFMREVYRTFVTSADNRARFGATLRDIASAGRAPLLYHCTAGKDRTGWTSWLLLTALGVPERTAVADYLASNTFRAAYDAQLRAYLKQAGLMQNPDLLIPLQEVRTEYLDAALAAVSEAYGNLYRYLTAGLGLEHRTLAALRAQLVG